MPRTRSTKTSDLDLHVLDLALPLAVKGEGQVKPNPLVGSVIVSDGILVGQGFHRDEGVKHAEVLALKQAGSLARSATRATYWRGPSPQIKSQERK